MLRGNFLILSNKETIIIKIKFAEKNLGRSWGASLVLVLVLHVVLAAATSSFISIIIQT